MITGWLVLCILAFQTLSASTVLASDNLPIATFSASAWDPSLFGELFGCMRWLPDCVISEIVMFLAPVQGYSTLCPHWFILNALILFNMLYGLNHYIGDITAEQIICLETMTSELALLKLRAQDNFAYFIGNDYCFLGNLGHSLRLSLHADKFLYLASDLLELQTCCISDVVAQTAFRHYLSIAPPCPAYGFFTPLLSFIKSVDDFETVKQKKYNRFDLCTSHKLATFWLHHPNSSIAELSAMLNRNVEYAEEMIYDFAKFPIAEIDNGNGIFARNAAAIEAWNIQLYLKGLWQIFNVIKFSHWLNEHDIDVLKLDYMLSESYGTSLIGHIWSSYARIPLWTQLNHYQHWTSPLAYLAFDPARYFQNSSRRLIVKAPMPCFIRMSLNWPESPMKSAFENAMLAFAETLAVSVGRLSYDAEDFLSAVIWYCYKTGRTAMFDHFWSRATRNTAVKFSHHSPVWDAPISPSRFVFLLDNISENLVARVLVAAIMRNDLEALHELRLAPHLHYKTLWNALRHGFPSRHVGTLFDALGYSTIQIRQAIRVNYWARARNPLEKMMVSAKDSLGCLQRYAEFFSLWYFYATLDPKLFASNVSLKLVKYLDPMVEKYY